jgi:poly [ADP-ribose] polymerase
VDKKSDEWQLLKDYVMNTHAPTHTDYTYEVLDIFTVNREGEDAKFEPWKDFENRQLLWHGSRLTNWVGILSQGLRYNLASKI